MRAKLKATASGVAARVSSTLHSDKDDGKKVYQDRTYVPYQLGSNCRSCGTLFTGNELMCAQCGTTRDGLADTGRYRRTDKVLGKGGFGEVFEGIDTVTNAKVAMKYVDVPLESKGARELIRSTVQEGQLLMELQHPNIIATHGVFVVSDPTGRDPSSSPPPSSTPGSTAEASVTARICMVMEMAGGGSVWDLMVIKDPTATGPNSSGKIRLRPLAEPFVQHIMRSVLHALAYLHQRGICHLDIKPMNVLLTDDKVVKLGDFGLAVCMDREVQKVGKLMGTPAWMAPELFHFLHRKKTDTRVDIWSLALSAETMLSGKMPYASMEGLVATFKAHRGTKDYILAPGLSPGATAFIQRCLKREPLERPSAAELLSDPWVNGLL